jgi:hypothetical protein
MLNPGELKRQLRIKPGHRVAVVNAPPESALIVPTAVGLDPHHADAVIGFPARPADLARLRPVYAAVRAARLAWISYPNPGRPGAELHRDWLVRALRQYGVEPVEDVWIDETWSALRLRPSPPPRRCGRFRP